MKKYSHSRQYGNRVTNPYTIIFSTAILCIWLISGNDYEDTYVAEKKAEVFMKPVVVEVKKEVVKVAVKKDSKATIEEKIRLHFPRNADVMVAIAYAESGMSMTAKGYNCFYNNDKTKVYRERVKGSYSAACLPEDRVYAHSADCYVLQDNKKGTTCPQGVTVDQHLKEMAELSKVCGLDCWWAYKNKTYLKYLAQQ